ncbi:tRNA lysidine(34) synthetase TilS [Balneolaceae bacterium ANBcel3]|nr:tRNA lysidine(34) synthetase TilS [Balneolaceae bacterium ANBcel3]
MNFDNDSIISQASRILLNAGIQKGNVLVTGVSGGVDSMALLHLLAIKLEYKVIAGHLNYGMRGQDSDEDEAMVRRFCERYEIPVYVMSAKEGKQGIQGNFQDYARSVRRSFLMELFKKYEASAIVLAHHRDDQIETIFQKILRGAAPEYWQGMRLSNDEWIRPLIEIRKKELVAYCEKYDVPWREDASNKGTDYARNVLRNKVFSDLDTMFPGWETNVLELNRFSRLHEQLLDQVLSEVLLNNTGHHQSTLDRSRWMSMDETVKAATIRHWIKKETGFISWTKGMFRSLEVLNNLQSGSRLELTKGLSILRERSHFVITVDSVPEDGKEGIPEYILDLQCDGNEKSGQAGYKKDNLFVITENPKEIDELLLKKDGYRGPDIRLLQLRIDALPGVIRLRRWRHGDRFQPLGMQGTQCVSDHLTDRKVSGIEKKETLVLVSFDDNIHAVIFPKPLETGQIGSIAENTRCAKAGEEVLQIKRT